MRNPVSEHREELQSFCGLDPKSSWGEPGDNDFSSDELESFANKSAYIAGLLPVPVPSLAAPLFERFVKGSARAFFGAMGKLGLYALIVGLVFSAPLIWALGGEEITGLVFRLVDEFRGFWVWVLSFAD